MEARVRPYAVGPTVVSAQFSTPRAENETTLGGTYALLLRLAQPAHLQVGRLGRFAFPSGYFLYLGSALGGLKGRLSRHLRWSLGAGGCPPLRWHIDYLLAQADLLEIWWQGGREERECAWAALARVAPGASLAAPRFGSSDCRCPGHLVYFPARPSTSVLRAGPISILELVGADTVSNQRSAVSRQRSEVSDNRGPGP